MEWVILFVTLCIIEVILGLDNIFAFAMIVQQAPKKSQNFVKTIALLGAFVLRIALLFTALYIHDLHYPIMVLGWQASMREIFLFMGGSFLVSKALIELRHYHQPIQKNTKPQKTRSLTFIILEILFVDLIFAVDSVFAAIAMTNEWVIISASIVSSIIFMYFAADIVIKYMNTFWRFHVLSLILLIGIGLFLMGQGLGIHGYSHFMIAIIIFSCVYESYMSYLEARRP